MLIIVGMALEAFV